MLQLAERQQDFAQALLDPGRPVPTGLIGPDGKPSNRRFAVYRNNVVAGLIDTLQAAFPAVCRIVGEEFFRAMARVFVASHPPESPIMLGYGKGFPEFIEVFEPATTLPYLSDVAHIERAWTEAYHAAEAVAIDHDRLAAIPPSELPLLHFAFHPSVHIVRSHFPSLTIWLMNVGEGVPHPVDITANGEDTLITRPDAEVEMRLLPEGGADFLQALGRGLSVLDATKTALRANSAFDLGTNLPILLFSGAVIGFRHSGSARSVIWEPRS